MTAPDATLRGFLGDGLKRAFNAVQAEVNATLAPLGLRMITCPALAVLRDAPGITAAGLADVPGLERPNLVLGLDELARAGLITRARPTAGMDDSQRAALRAALARIEQNGRKE